ncbi:MAG: hypothetical protein Q7T26_04910 [Dehalococcoidia bacterium]|nr:hypothetical protein [Dehalococcoidia bacterium]
MLFTLLVGLFADALGFRPPARRVMAGTACRGNSEGPRDTCARPFGMPNQ